MASISSPPSPWGFFSACESALAAQLWPRLPDASLVIIDRGFSAYAPFHQLGDPVRQRHWLTRTRTGPTALQMKDRRAARAHVLARHGAERMSQGNLLGLGGLVVGVGAATMGIDPKAAMEVFAVTADLGVLRPWGRSQESEADHLGLLLMAQAGYDPREALPFWRRMHAATGDQGPPEFVSTHPSHETRMQQIEAWLPEALGHFEAANAAPVERLPLP